MLWLEEPQLERWRQPERIGCRGSPMIYSDWAIQCALTIREVSQCSLRVREGFFNSLVKLLSLLLKVPNDSTLSRRQHTLMVKLPRASNRTPRYRVVDSTGLEVYGEGEWQVRQPGLSQRRTRRKLHRVGDANIQSIVAAELTANVAADPEVPDRLKQLPDNEAIATLSGDGAYDTEHCHQAITAKWHRL